MSSRLSKLAKAVTQSLTAVARSHLPLSRRTTYPLRVACVILPALLFGGLAWIDYRIELDRTRNDVATTVNAIAEHAQTVMETADLVIARVLEHIDNSDWDLLAASQETHDFLAHLRRELPQVEAVFLVDPDGVIAASSRAFPMPRYDVHVPEYFAATKSQNNDAIVISAPFAGAMSGTTGFIVSRRRVRNGVFDGVVGVTISQQYFEAFYRAILDSLTNSAAGLVRTDGAVLVQFPIRPAVPLSYRLPIRCWWRPTQGATLMCSTATRSPTALTGLPASGGSEICRCWSATPFTVRCSSRTGPRTQR